jgi:hypothetical protein
MASATLVFSVSTSCPNEIAEIKEIKITINPFFGILIFVIIKFLKYDFLKIHKDHDTAR